jgi:hypothetical protein
MSRKAAPRDEGISAYVCLSFGGRGDAFDLASVSLRLARQRKRDA